MKVCINTKECKKENIPIDVMMYALAAYLGTPVNSNTFEEACKRGLILYDGFTLMREPINLRLTETGNELIERILLNSEYASTPENEQFFKNLAQKMREIYPEGKKPGTKLMWRDSEAIIVKKLQTVMKKYGVTFTEEEALDATRRYVNSFTDTTMMHILRYFILKRDRNTGEETSQFLSYLENKRETETSDEYKMNKIR